MFLQHTIGKFNKLTFSSNRSNLLVASVTALSVTFLWFWLTWRYGFDLADEGFYWYGAQRVLRGEVPIRDFMSYDIGRYYWAASLMWLLDDDGVFAARVSAVAYQFLGTFLGAYICLLALRHNGAVRWLYALLVAAILTVWVVPYYKAYDHATSVIIVALLVLMLKVTKPAAWLAAGICLGFAAIIGRNHGAYGVFAVVFVISVLLFKAPSRHAVVRLCGCFFLGVVIGFSPTLITMLTVDGFAGSFIGSIVSMVGRGATNIALPVPWPWLWHEDFGRIGVVLTAVRLSLGVGFVFLLVFPVVWILALAYRRFDLSDDSQKVYLATVAAAIPYAHYAFSRADLIHLSLSIFPGLIGLLAAVATMSRLRSLMVSLVVLAVSVLTVVQLQFYLSAQLIKNDLLQADVGGEQLWVEHDLFKKMEFVKMQLSSLTSSSGKFLAIPDMPGFHAIYRVKMPIWEIYPLVPRDAKFEAREIERLESSVPEVVFFSDHAVDNNPKFRYSQMHPLTYAWILSNYHQSGDHEKKWSPDLKIYVLKHLE